MYICQWRFLNFIVAKSITFIKWFLYIHDIIRGENIIVMHLTSQTWMWKRDFVNDLSARNNTRGHYFILIFYKNNNELVNSVTRIYPLFTNSSCSEIAFIDFSWYYIIIRRMASYKRKKEKNIWRTWIENATWKSIWIHEALERQEKCDSQLADSGTQ